MPETTSSGGTALRLMALRSDDTWIVRAPCAVNGCRGSVEEGVFGNSFDLVRLLFWLFRLAAVLAPLGSENMPPLPRLALEGLAERWENDEACRRRMLNDNALMIWKSPASTGVPSMEHAKMNYPSLVHFFEVWAELCDHPRTPSLPQIKKQAGQHFMLSCIGMFMGPFRLE